MTSEVSVITDQRDDVIRIRNTALRARLPDHLRPPEPTEAEGMDGLVYVVTESYLEARRVQTGLSDGVHTELLRGLEPGETVAVGMSLTSQYSSETRSPLSRSKTQSLHRLPNCDDRT